MKTYLNFGCGNNIRKNEKNVKWDNADIQKGKNVKSFDFNKFPYPLKDNSYEYILIDNVLEHLEHPDKVLEELRRIAKKNAVIEIIAPHYTNKGAYSDVQHKHFFNEICFKYLEKPISSVSKEKKFKILSLELTPTLPGKFIPGFLREKMSLFINGLISQIHVKLKVLK